jgi:hypothetical protein
MLICSSNVFFHKQPGSGTGSEIRLDPDIKKGEKKDLQHWE